MKTYLPYIAGLALLAALVIFGPKACNREPSQNQLFQQQAKTAEWQAKAVAAQAAVEGLKQTNDILASRLFVLRDSVRILRKRPAHLYVTSAYAEIRVDTVRDTIIHNIPQDLPVASSLVVLPRTGIIGDSTRVTWLDRLAVRSSVVGHEVTAAEVHFDIDDFQTQFTEKIAPGFWIALLSLAGIAAASLYFNFKP